MLFTVKRSMRIGTKITVISCIAAVMAAISMVLVTIIVFMSFVRTIQEDETATGVNAVSYTHLDVYKRQAACRPKAVLGSCFRIP